MKAPHLADKFKDDLSTGIDELRPKQLCSEWQPRQELGAIVDRLRHVAVFPGLAVDGAIGELHHEFRGDGPIGEVVGQVHLHCSTVQVEGGYFMGGRAGVEGEEGESDGEEGGNIVVHDGVGFCVVVR